MEAQYGSPLYTLETPRWTSVVPSSSVRWDWGWWMRGFGGSCHTEGGTTETLGPVGPGTPPEERNIGRSRLLGVVEKSLSLFFIIISLSIHLLPGA